MVQMKPTRDGYGEGLLYLVENNPNVIVMDADVAKSTRTEWIKQKHPDRFIDMGISEQDMVATAAGLALGGKIPFVSTYGVFLAGRAWDQIRTSVCYMDLNVKFGGAHGGLSVGPDGATHQALEEFALMRVLPNMALVVPADAVETKKATIAAASIPGPVYIRFGREPVPVITNEDSPFEIGKANLINDGKDVTIIANGQMVYQSMLAAEELNKQGVSAKVINLHTLKPIDEEIIMKAAKETGCIVTAEEHQIYGGLGSTVAEVVVKNYPVPMEFVGVKDTFGESGQPEELMEAYGLTWKDIVDAAFKAMSRK
ncbi:MAG: transketolase family protein [Thermoanaerobacteraceae bacterium]|nr:transketolase family protein [Thermoanaerobacteraceae bacterium]